MTFRYTPRGPRHVAIVGSRHITSYADFCRTVRSLLRPSDVIVSGGADGVDSLAARFARQNRHQLVEHLPDETIIQQAMSEGLDRRSAYGRAAFARNQQIVDKSDVMIAIACPHSRGTLDSIAKMSRKLRNAGIEPRSTQGIVYLYNYLWDCGKQGGK